MNGDHQHLGRSQTTSLPLQNATTIDACVSEEIVFPYTLRHDLYGTSEKDFCLKMVTKEEQEGYRTCHILLQPFLSLRLLVVGTRSNGGKPHEQISHNANLVVLMLIMLISDNIDSQIQHQNIENRISVQQAASKVESSQLEYDAQRKNVR